MLPAMHMLSLPAGHLEGDLLWDLWLNWNQFDSLLEEDSVTEEHLDFFRQILQGCIGLHMASEAKSDPTIDFLVFNLLYPPLL